MFAKFSAELQYEKHCFRLCCESMEFSLQNASRIIKIELVTVKNHAFKVGHGIWFSILCLWWWRPDLSTNMSTLKGRIFAVWRSFEMFLGILNTYMSISFDWWCFWANLLDLEHVQTKKTTVKFLIFWKFESAIEKDQNGVQNVVEDFFPSNTA